MKSFGVFVGTCCMVSKLKGRFRILRFWSSLQSCGTVLGLVVAAVVGMVQGWKYSHRSVQEDVVALVFLWLVFLSSIIGIL